ncbi:MAG: hypothetical protein OS112_04460 [Methanoregula sp.]|nr:MAG: hypothetical protein OS112_04460 [Methanoregula sp.]
MAKTIHTGNSGPVTTLPLRGKARKFMHGVPAKDLRAPVQVLKSTKQWLDQIIEEKQFRTYDEAIMFLIMERQKHLPSDFGVFSDLAEYRCSGED